MKFIIIATACLLAVVLADDRSAQVIRNEAEVNPDSFKYAYEFDNSIKAEQQGNLQGPENWVVNGQFSFTSPEGEQVALTYTADENGYHVDSANPLLPTPPPIPEAILKSLEYIAAHPAPEANSKK